MVKIWGQFEVGVGGKGRNGMNSQDRGLISLFLEHQLHKHCERWPTMDSLNRGPPAQKTSWS